MYGLFLYFNVTLKNLFLFTKLKNALIKPY